MNNLSSAISALRKGGFIVLHEAKGREDESYLICLGEYFMLLSLSCKKQ